MTRLLTVPLLLAALVLAACGGDDGMPADEYRAEAARICRDSDRATRAIEQPTRATPEAISNYFRRLLEPNERATTRFSELDPPEELQDAHDDVIAANREGVTIVERVIEDLDGGEEPRQVLTEASERLRTLNRRAEDAARRLGVPACADE